MHIYPFHDIRLFCHEVHPFLLAHEAQNQLLLGLLDGLEKSGWQDIYAQPPVMAVVRDDSQQIVCMTLRTPPNVILVSSGPDGAIDVLTQWHIKNNTNVPGVMSLTPQACRFAQLWSQQTGRAHRKRLEMIAHELTVVHPVHALGYMRAGEASDRALLVEWTQGFIEETGISHAPPAEQSVDRRLRQRDILVWIDGGVPRAMLQIGGETPNGKRVGGVYTPRQYRRRGYATALVAAASQLVLNSGKKSCFLFTDAANPTSNHIYRQIGYAPVGEFTQVDFDT